MKFSCEKGLLQSACTIASRATASKSPIPALEGLLIEARADVKITGYDLKEGIYTNIQADVSQGGAIVVGARFFGEMIRRLPDGIVTVSTDLNNSVKVRCGKSEFNFMGISAEDYPEMPVVDGINTVELPQSVLRSMINQTIFAVADTDVRPIYTGTLFEVEGDRLTLVSVDGYRLAKRCEKLEKARMENCSFVVPGSALSDIERICADTEDPVQISVGAKHISFQLPPLHSRDVPHPDPGGPERDHVGDRPGGPHHQREKQQPRAHELRRRGDRMLLRDPLRQGGGRVHLRGQRQRPGDRLQRPLSDGRAEGRRRGHAGALPEHRLLPLCDPVGRRQRSLYLYDPAGKTSGGRIKSEKRKVKSEEK